MSTVTVTETINEVTVSHEAVAVTATAQETPVTVAAGVTDHGALSGLADDDHSQYLTTARHAAIGSNPHGVTASDVGALPLTGGTMTGALVLDGDPAQALEAATKQYVDAAAGATNLDDLLDVDAANPTDTQVLTWDDDAGMWIAADAASGGASDVDDLTTATGNAGEMVRVAAAGGLEYRSTAEVLSDIGAAAAADLADYLPLAGGTMTGALSIPGVGTNSLRLGADTAVASQNTIVIGDNAVEDGFSGNAVIIGQGASHTGGQGTILIGKGASSAVGEAVIIGHLASGAQDAVIIGSGGNSTQTRAVVIGKGASVTSIQSIAVGYSASAAQNSVALGSRATAGTGAVAVGSASNAGIYGIAIGPLATTTKQRQAVLGSSVFPVNELFPYSLTALTNTIQNIYIANHKSSGTPAAGFGAGLLYQLESSTTENRDAARIAAVWQTATDASRKADLVLSAYDTAEREGLRVRADGSKALLITDLPTSDPAVAGALWSDGGTVKVSSG